MKGATIFVGTAFALLLAGCTTENDRGVSSRNQASLLGEQTMPEQTDVSRYVAAMSEQPGRFKLGHRCGHRNSWYSDRGLGPTNEGW
jgi:hypothetical protein